MLLKKKKKNTHQKERKTDNQGKRKCSTWDMNPGLLTPRLVCPGGSGDLGSNWSLTQVPSSLSHKWAGMKCWLLSMEKTWARKESY